MSRKVQLDLERSPVGVGIRKIGQWVEFGDFTDGAGAAGTLNLSKQLPAGAIVLASKVTTTEGFAGDTSAAMIIGLTADTDRYSLADVDVFSVAANQLTGIDSAEGGVAAPALITTDTTVLVTITAGSDWGLVTAGKAFVEVIYLSTNPEVIDKTATRYDG